MNCSTPAFMKRKGYLRVDSVHRSRINYFVGAVQLSFSVARFGNEQAAVLRGIVKVDAENGAYQRPALLGSSMSAAPRTSKLPLKMILWAARRPSASFPMASRALFHVVQLKQSGDAKPQNFRFKLDTSVCGGCKLPEYACTCHE
jgi:hypothetical protein